MELECENVIENSLSQDLLVVERYLNEIEDKINSLYLEIDYIHGIHQEDDIYKFSYSLVLGYNKFIFRLNELLKLITDVKNKINIKIELNFSKIVDEINTNVSLDTYEGYINPDAGMDSIFKCYLFNQYHELASDDKAMKAGYEFMMKDYKNHTKNDISKWFELHKTIKEFRHLTAVRKSLDTFIGSTDNLRKLIKLEEKLDVKTVEDVLVFKKNLEKDLELETLISIYHINGFKKESAGVSVTTKLSLIEIINLII